jgi:hypothetical protein
MVVLHLVADGRRGGLPGPVRLMRRLDRRTHNAGMGEPAESFTDEEYAFLRHVRFGELPPRVGPDERVEFTETEPRRDRPEPAGGPDEWNLRLGPGG